MSEPLEVTLLNAWAQTLLFFGLNRRALPVFREVVRRSPRRHEAWSVLAFLHAQRGELSEAIPAFERALALQPNDPALAFNAGFTMQRAGRHGPAMEQFLRAIELDPKLDRAWYGLGLSLAHDGRYEEAVARFREAARLQPFNPHAGYHACRRAFQARAAAKSFTPSTGASRSSTRRSRISMRREFGIGGMTYNGSRRASPHCSLVNLVRSGRKQPQPGPASAGVQARLELTKR